MLVILKLGFISIVTQSQSDFNHIGYLKALLNKATILLPLSKIEFHQMLCFQTKLKVGKQINSDESKVTSGWQTVVAPELQTGLARAGNAK